MQPGAKRIGSFSNGKLISIKKDGTVYLFVKNESSNKKTFTCIEKGETVTSATVPPKSVAVILYKRKI